MEGVCTESLTRFPHPKIKPTVEIPPRKLLFSTAKTIAAAVSPTTHKHGGYNRNTKMVSEEDHNKESEYCYDSDTDDPYATDHFRMFEFKIRRCTRSRSHDWTDCPFAHPGEKARRRDPRRYHYSGDVCPEFRRGGGCSRGDDCEFAHGVFECWLHPSRYRTEACKDGKHCKRKVCFFAHSPRQLRVLPPENVSGGACTSSPSSSLSPASVLGSGGNKSRCCLFCHSVGSSPTSTLLGLSHLSRSPSVSPPLSPANKAAALSRLRTIGPPGGTVTYKDVLNELMSSLESMSLTEALVNSSSPATATAAGLSPTVANHPHLPWLDVDLNGDHQDLQVQQQQPQTHLPFALSPVNSFSDGGGAAAAANENVFEDGYGDPDIGWVNDLLM